MPEEQSENNSRIKRYILSKDRQINERLGIVENVFKKLQQQHPETIGMTLYGSLVTGGAHEKSDIDGFIFIDEIATRNFTEDDMKWAKTERAKAESSKPKWSTSKTTELDDLAATSHYTPKVERLFNEAGIPREMIEDVRIRIISQKIIHQEIQRAIDEEGRIVEHEEKQKRWLEMLEQKSAIGLLRLHERPAYPKTESIDWKIPALFHLAVGNGLESYRSVVLQKLASQDVLGGRVWKKIIDRTADMEQHLRGSNYTHLYPQTIEEAVAKYNLNISPEIA